MPFWAVALIVLVLMMLISMAFVSLGIALASTMEDMSGFQLISNFIIMPMFFLSWSMYPVKLLPAVLRAASRLNPLTYGVDALKNTVFASPLRSGPMSPDFSFSADLYASAVGPAWGTMRIENAGGAWEGTCRGAGWNGGDAGARAC